MVAKKKQNFKPPIKAATAATFPAGQGEVKSSGLFLPETGVGYHAKNREIKKGYTPTIQVFKIIRRNHYEKRWI